MKERGPDRPVYVISIAAELIGCHPRTLRIYEERGLLSPVRRHRIRLYSERDIERVRLIRYLTEERGLNLAGVRLVLEIQEHYHEEITWVYNEAPSGSQHDGEESQDKTRARENRGKGGKGR